MFVFLTSFLIPFQKQMLMRVAEYFIDIAHFIFFEDAFSGQILEI
jgi:hypothetical protein